MSNKDEEEPNLKKYLILRYIGFALLIGGIIMAVTGGITMYRGFGMDPFTNGGLNPDKSKTTVTGMGLLAGGFFMIIPSIFLLCVSAQLGMVSKMGTETFGHDNEFERYEKMMKEGSKPRHAELNRVAEISAETGMSDDKIVKIRCQLCGALNDEDAKFCDQCSQPL
ncbi:MAG: hypothetical protein ACFFDH_10340 [Promethearchaeota archaeon]